MISKSIYVHILLCRFTDGFGSMRSESHQAAKNGRNPRPAARTACLCFRASSTARIARHWFRSGRYHPKCSMTHCGACYKAAEPTRPGSRGSRLARAASPRLSRQGSQRRSSSYRAGTGRLVLHGTTCTCRSHTAFLTRSGPSNSRDPHRRAGSGLRFPHFPPRAVPGLLQLFSTIKAMTGVEIAHRARTRSRRPG
jgi:hypothetical protein